LSRATRNFDGGPGPGQFGRGRRDLCD
jgi:hypothetical protein